METSSIQLLCAVCIKLITIWCVYIMPCCVCMCVCVHVLCTCTCVHFVSMYSRGYHKYSRDFPTRICTSMSHWMFHRYGVQQYRSNIYTSIHTCKHTLHPYTCIHCTYTHVHVHIWCATVCICMYYGVLWCVLVEVFLSPVGLCYQGIA